MSVTWRWGLLVIEVPPGWSACGCERVKLAEIFMSNRLDKRASKR